eukprot:Skav232416  [mRNA]  locus=scaffold189:12699:16578:+ [translate_table: standard]
MIEEDAAVEERSFLFPKQLDDPAESPGGNEEPDSGKDLQEWLAREQEDSDMDEFEERAADTGKERSDKARLLAELSRGHAGNPVWVEGNGLDESVPLDGSTAASRGAESGLRPFITNKFPDIEEDEENDEEGDSTSRGTKSGEDGPIATGEAHGSSPGDGRSADREAKAMAGENAAMDTRIENKKTDVLSRTGIVPSDRTAVGEDTISKPALTQTRTDIDKDEDKETHKARSSRLENGSGLSGLSEARDPSASKTFVTKKFADPGSIQDSSRSTPELLSSKGNLRSSGTAGAGTVSRSFTREKPTDADDMDQDDDEDEGGGVSSQSSHRSSGAPESPDRASQTVATKKSADTASMYNANGNNAALQNSKGSLGSGTSAGEGTASKSFLAQKPTDDPDNMDTDDDDDDKGEDLGSQSSLRSNEAAAIGEDTMSKSIPTKKSADTANMYNGNKAALQSSKSSLGSTGTSPGQGTVSKDLTTQKPAGVDSMDKDYDNDKGKALSSQSSHRSSGAPESPDRASQTVATKKSADTASMYNANGNNAALQNSKSSLGSGTSAGEGTASKSFLAQKPTDDPDNMDTDDDDDDKGEDLGSQSSLRSNEAAAIGEDTMSKSIPTKKSADTANMYNGNKAALQSSKSSLGSSGTAGAGTVSRSFTTQKPTNADDMDQDDDEDEGEGVSSQSSHRSSGTPESPDPASQTVATKKSADTANMYNAKGNKAALLTSKSSLGSTGTSAGERTKSTDTADKYNANGNNAEFPSSKSSLGFGTSAGEGTASKSFLAQKPTDDPDNMDTDDDDDDKGEDLGSQSSLRSNEAAAVGEDSGVESEKSTDTANMYNGNRNPPELLSSKSSFPSSGVARGHDSMSFAAAPVGIEKGGGLEQGEAMSSQSSHRSSGAPESPDRASQSVATKKSADTANMYDANGNKAELLNSKSSLGSTGTAGAVSRSFTTQKPTDADDMDKEDDDDDGKASSIQSRLRSSETAAVGEDAFFESPFAKGFASEKVPGKEAGLGQLPSQSFLPMNPVGG